jgi:hypothetical protein
MTTNEWASRPAEWTGATVKLPIRLTLLSVAATSTLQAAVVLQYHHVGMTTPASTSTSPERFALHLDYVARHDFEVVPLQRLVDMLRAGVR